MKKTTVFLLFLLVSTSMIAQSSEGLKSMSQGNKNAFTVTLGKTVKKEVEKAWIKYIKDYKGKTKKNKKTGEIFSDNAEIKAMSSNTIDVYATVVQNNVDTELTVWFDLGGAYVNSDTHIEAYAIVESMLDKFTLKVSRAAVEEQLEAEKDQLKKLNKDLSSLEKNKDNLEGDIKKYEEKITQAKQEIETNIVDQKTKKEEIEKQQEAVKAIEQKLKSLD